MGWSSVFRILETRQKKTVLEIGIGTGRIAVKVAPYCMRLAGIDVSPKTIESSFSHLADVIKGLVFFDKHHAETGFGVSAP